MTIRDYVIKCLKEFPETRNDDKLLYIKTLEAMGLIEVVENKVALIDMNKLYQLPSFESIRRRRQEIQNDEKLFLPYDPLILVKRAMYVECPRERLAKDNHPKEVLDAVCRKCPKYRTEDCNLLHVACGIEHHPIGVMKESVFEKIRGM